MSTEYLLGRGGGAGGLKRLPKSNKRIRHIDHVWPLSVSARLDRVPNPSFGGLQPPSRERAFPLCQTTAAKLNGHDALSSHWSSVRRLPGLSHRFGMRGGRQVRHGKGGGAWTAKH
jgi:hypothetical protein